MNEIVAEINTKRKNLDHILEPYLAIEPRQEPARRPSLLHPIFGLFVDFQRRKAESFNELY